MKSLYLECNAGISGDMLVAALLDLGADKEALDKALQSIPAKGFEYKISRVSKAGVDCCDFDVILDEEHANHDHDMAFLHGNGDAVVHSHEHEHEHHHAHDHEHEHEHHHDHDHEHEHSHVPHEHHHHHEHRGLQEVIAIIDATDMSAAAKELALKIFDIIADAEAKAHAVEKNAVHFHEVGAIDSIVDIVAIAVCADSLGVENVIVPELCEGRGTVRCQHGVLPVPVPATANIMQRFGFNVRLLPVQGEFVTPTGAAAAADGTPAAGTPFQIFSRGVAGFFEMFGVPNYAATVFMTMCVSALALTSLDAVARIARMSFQELFSVDDMAHAEPWRKLLCNTYFSTVLTLVLGYVLTKIGYSNIWPLFGSANQLLSALVLITLCVFLKVTGRSNKMLFPPLVIMLCVTFTALVQRLMAMVSAIQNAAAVTIPAGETTWGAVFIANGLQLIIAVLLIVLGATIVVNSMRSYVASKHNSEAKA